MDSVDAEDVDIMGCSDNSRESQSPIRSNDLLLAPSHQKWSNEEHELFIVGFEQFGNKWSKIAKLIGTRSPTQVKHYAKKYLKEKECKDKNRFYEKPIVDGSKLMFKLASTQEQDDMDSLCFESSTGTFIQSEVLRIESSEDVSSEDIEIDDNENNLKKESCKDEDYPKYLSQGTTDKYTSASVFREDDPLILDYKITEEEKVLHSEFFQGKPKKTPERYIKIRCHVIKRWEQCKPHYLTKTAARIGLNHCGDVNAIGRIHTHLEETGTINYNCKKPENQAGRPRKSKYELLGSESFQISNYLKIANQVEPMSLRKRKAPEMSIGELDLSNKGVTIEHGQDGGIVNQIIITEPPKHKKAATPFRLVPCEVFSTNYPAPFELKVYLSAVQLVHIHAFCFQTEVIGLLGGRFSLEKKELVITSTAPCDSLSTDFECEMDPVSQTIAKEWIENRGEQVVGWYHSHPTFEPNPSCRDLETQAKFQDLFHCQGRQPFVALIVSPFLQETSSARSCYWMLCDRASSKPNTVPYSIEPSFYDSGDSIVLIEQTKELLNKAKLHPDRTVLTNNCWNEAAYTYVEKVNTPFLVRLMALNVGCCN